MTDPSGDARAGDFERQLRDMNEALLVSSVHQHELTEIAQRAEAAAANEIAERKQAESLIQCQKASLELLVNGEPIERVLDFLASRFRIGSRRSVAARSPPPGCHLEAVRCVGYRGVAFRLGCVAFHNAL